jgi:hypothetical protein
LTAYYELEGMKYQVVSDKSGYMIVLAEKISKGRKLQTIIIFTKAAQTSYGYFTDGNLILEHYDGDRYCNYITIISKNLKKSCLPQNRIFCFFLNQFLVVVQKCFVSSVSTCSSSEYNLLDILQRTEAHHEILYIPYIFLEQCNIPHQISAFAHLQHPLQSHQETTFPLFSRPSIPISSYIIG